MARLVSMQRYRFDRAKWAISISNQEIATRFGRAFQRNSIFGEEGERYGFVNCRYLDGIVVGYFAQEGNKEIIQYDQNLQPQTTNENSFAHILFALHIESGIVAIQSKRIIGFVDLTRSIMRDKFPLAVEDLMKQMQIPVIRLFLEKDDLEITPAQLYEIFQNYKTTALNIVNLKGRQVPTYEEFKIFNPRVNEDMIFRQIFEEDIQAGLDSIVLESPDTDNLQDTAMARLAANVGDIKSLTIDPQGNGREIPLSSKVEDGFKVTVSSEDEKQTLDYEDVRAMAQPMSISISLQLTPEWNVSQLVSEIAKLFGQRIEGGGDDD